MKTNKVNKHVFKALCAASDSGSSSTALNPAFSNLSQVAGKQPQRAFAYVILDDLRGRIVQDPHLSRHARVRIAASSRTGAGRFMIVLPGMNKQQLLLSEEQYLDNVIGPT